MERSRTRITLGVLMAVLMLPACQPVKTELRHTFRPGSQRTASVTIESTMTLNASIGSVTVESHRDARLTLRVIALLDDGSGAIDVRIDDMTLSMSTAMGNEDVAAQFGWTDLLGDGAKALAGEHFSAVISPQGEIMAIEGIEQLQARALKAMDLPERLHERITGEQVMNLDLARDLIRPVFCRFPDHGILPADTWTISEQVSTPVAARIDRTWQAPDAIAASETFRYTIRIYTPPYAEATVLGTLGGPINLEGTGAGEVRIEPDTGWLVDRDERVALSGTIQLRISENLPPGRPQPVSIEVRIQAAAFDPEGP